MLKSKTNLIIKNGNIYNGKGGKPFLSDISISNDKIEKIAPNIDAEGAIVLDAKGLSVSPGFVDVHSHSDYYLLINPLAEGKIRQGVTTEIGGNCGYSPAPLMGKLLAERVKGYKDEFDIDVPFKNFKEYFDQLNKDGLSLNFAAQVGHNTVRASVMGIEDRPPTAKEMDEMSRLVEEAFEQGVFGISLGLIYAPSCYSRIDELIHISRVAGKKGGVLSTHIRSEGKALIEAVEEVIHISEAAEIPLQISHIKTSGEENWTKIDKVFLLIEAAIDRGVQVTCDRYPYIASNTGLLSALPEWTYVGGKTEILKRLTDKKIREDIRSDLAKDREKRWNEVMISYVLKAENKKFEGRLVTECAKEEGKSPTDFVFDMLIDEDTCVDAIYFTMCEKNLERILKKPYVMIGSDSGAKADYGKLSTGMAHPRGFGTFPRVIRHYSGERKLFDTATAIKKMTFLPCRKFNIPKRGELAEGYYADITIFDHNKISDLATYSTPYRYPEGIRYVIVNGKLTVKDGVHTGEKNGRVLFKE